jgi:putative phosphoesterase
MLIFAPKIKKEILKLIGLLSDTHGYLDDRILYHFENCDEIWHAGDIGSMEVLEQLENYKPVRAVYGNIDEIRIRSAVPEIQRFLCEETDVLMKHIGGYPGRYDRSIWNEINKNSPKLFISGHSHILKVIPDKKLNLLHINPGAAGKSGLHKVRTLVRFVIDGSNIRDLEVVELEQR